MDSKPRVGIEWADDLEGEIGERLSEIDSVELIPENFFKNNRPAFLEQLREHNTPVLVHAVELSVGTADRFRQEHFERCLNVMEQVPVVNLSDHLCMTEAGGIEIGQLTPLPWNQAAIDVVCRNIETIQAATRVPFLIENITNRFQYPNPEMPETEFINTITKKTGCGLLLDVTNVYTNATNFNYDPFDWIDQLDLSTVEGVHLAGGHYDSEGTLVDSHSYHVFDEVWDIYRYVCAQIRPKDTIVEWTENTPLIDELFEDVKKARKILEETESLAPIPTDNSHVMEAL